MVARTLAPAEPIYVGASGGGDSTALLVLLADVARVQGRPLVAGIVDHTLREGSAADAARAASIAAHLGAEPHVLRLQWPDGPKTAQSPARTARYAALARLARQVGTSTLFLGHTLDDQAETLLMRADARSGARGMAGMAPLSPCPIWPEAHDLHLARPLLDWRREELRDLLLSAGVDWLEDPANALPRFARVRARARLLASGAAAALAASAAAHAAVATEADRAARAFLADAASFHEGSASLRRVSAEEACVRAVSVLATAIGGGAREPSEAAVVRLAVRLMAGQDSTLAGARFRAGEPIRVTRDPGGVLGRRGGGRPLADLVLPEGETVVWDGRLALTALETGWSAIPLGTGASGPALCRGDEFRQLAEAPITARWLIGARIDRLLWRAGA